LLWYLIADLGGLSRRNTQNALLRFYMKLLKMRIF